MPLPSTIGIRSVKGQRGKDLDFGIVPLSASSLGKLAQNIFLCSTDINEADLPDERTLSSFHFVIGFPVHDYANRDSRRAVEANLSAPTTGVDDWTEIAPDNSAHGADDVSVPAKFKFLRLQIAVNIHSYCARATSVAFTGFAGLAILAGFIPTGTTKSINPASISSQVCSPQ